MMKKTQRNMYSSVLFSRRNFVDLQLKCRLQKNKMSDDDDVDDKVCGVLFKNKLLSRGKMNENRLRQNQWQ